MYSLWIKESRKPEETYSLEQRKAKKYRTREDFQYSQIFVLWTGLSDLLLFSVSSPPTLKPERNFTINRGNLLEICFSEHYIFASYGFLVFFVCLLAFVIDVVCLSLIRNVCLRSLVKQVSWVSTTPKLEDSLVIFFFSQHYLIKTWKRKILGIMLCYYKNKMFL